MSKYAANSKLKNSFAGIEWGRDSERRCINCGAFAPGKPLCDECTAEIMKVVEERRWRMQLVFYFITFLGALTYFLVI